MAADQAADQLSGGRPVVAGTAPASPAPLPAAVGGDLRVVQVSRGSVRPNTGTPLASDVGLYRDGSSPQQGCTVNPIFVRYG